jgi:hypothetical protein
MPVRKEKSWTAMIAAGTQAPSVVSAHSPISSEPLFNHPGFCIGVPWPASDRS